MIRNAPAFDFEYCSAPVSFTEFASDYWEKEPLIIYRNDPAYYGGLFSIEDLDPYLQLLRLDRDPGAILLANSKSPPHADKITQSIRGTASS